MRATPVSGLRLSLGEHPPCHPQKLMHSFMQTPNFCFHLSSMPSFLMALRTLTYSVLGQKGFADSP